MVKQANGVRKQFLIVGEDVILAFVEKGQKFSECESMAEVSADVSCKVSSIRKSIYLYSFLHHLETIWTFKC